MARPERYLAPGTRISCPLTDCSRFSTATQISKINKFYRKQFKTFIHFLGKKRKEKKTSSVITCMFGMCCAMSMKDCVQTQSTQHTCSPRIELSQTMFTKVYRYLLPTGTTSNRSRSKVAAPAPAPSVKNLTKLVNYRELEFKSTKLS